MSTKAINLIGAGGQAAVVLDALLAAGTAPEAIAVWAQDAKAAGGNVLGVPVRHLAHLDQLAGQGFHICIGDNATRQRLHLALIAAGSVPVSILHPAAIVSAHASLGTGSFVAARAILAPRSSVGDGVIVNHGAVVDHDCRLSDFVHVAPGATLGGGVQVGDLVLIGAGANILPSCRIGSGAIVGAGAVVICDMPERAVFVGIPAAPQQPRRS
ncbi:MAG: NeuD/PglB/VioB family sugar acetyltransferase [Devosia sp.]